MIHSLRSVHNVTQGLALCCVTFELILVAMQLEARIDTDSILIFLCVALLPLFLICVSQCKANLYAVIANFIDIDECLLGVHNCDRNAFCFNNNGGFECTCKENYLGNGTSCISKLIS